MTDTAESEDTEKTEETEEIAEDLGDVFTGDEAEKGDTSDDKSNDNDQEGDDAKDAKEEKSDDKKSDDETSEEDSETSSDEEPKSVPIAALHDERRKGKAAREELEQYKARYDKDDDAPDPAEDPEGYEKHIEAKVSRRMETDRINDSRDRMLEKHDDYEEMERTFMVLQGLDPSLKDELNKHPDPALFAYEKGKAYFEDQRKKLLGEIEAEKGKGSDDDDKDEETSEADKKKQKALKVPDLTKAASKGSNSEEKEIDDSQDLNALFDD